MQSIHITRSFAVELLFDINNAAYEAIRDAQILPTL